MKKYERAVVLLSGGMDSSIALHIAASECGELHVLSFCYGQPHEQELKCAKWQAQQVNAKSHRIMDFSLALWGGSSLTDSTIPIEAGDTNRTEAPNTYVPARNMIFIAVAASLAEAIGASAIYLGVSEADYSGYVDCRQEFINAMERAVNTGTERKLLKGAPITLETPLMHLRKVDEIKLAKKLEVDLGHTWSCYHSEPHPCQKCDSCLLRARAFAEAGVRDPLLNV